VSYSFFVALSSVKRDFACFLLILVSVGLVVLSKPVMAENFIEVTEVHGPTTGKIMPGKNFTVRVTVTWSVDEATQTVYLPTGGSIWVTISDSTSYKNRKYGMARIYHVDKTVFDGYKYSHIFELLNDVEAPDQQGIWPLYAQAAILTDSNQAVAVSDFVPFSVQIGNSTQTIPFATPIQETIMMIFGIGVACVVLQYAKHPRKMQKMGIRLS